MAAADDAGVRQGVEVRARLLDDSIEALSIAARISQRAVDPDLVDGRPDLCGQLGIHHRCLLERVLLVGADEPVAALLVADRRTQALPAAALAVLFAGPHTNADVDGQRRREWAAEQVGKPRRVGRQGRCGEVNRLLERAVLVAQPRGVLADVDRGSRTPADRPEDAVTNLRRLLEAGRVRDLARCRELLEQSLLLVFCELGGGVKTLPQQREGLGAIEQPGVDASAAQHGLDLADQPRTLDCRVAMRLQQRAASGPGRHRAKLLTAVVDDGAVRDEHPPPCCDCRLLGTGRGADRLARGGHQPQTRGGERRLPGEPVTSGGDLRRPDIGGERVGDRDRIGLRQDHEPLPVGNDPAQVSEAVLDALAAPTGLP